MAQVSVEAVFGEDNVACAAFAQVNYYQHRRRRNMLTVYEIG